MEIIYYTDNRLDPIIMAVCQQQLKKAAEGTRIISISLQPIDFGENIVMNLQRGYLTMFRQILCGLEECKSNVVFFAEHDILYHPSHFDFAPKKSDIFYYNENTWKVDANTGQALFYYCKQTLSLCASRDLLLEHYRKRVERVEQEGYSTRMGFEPGTHHRPERVDNYEAEGRMSKFPNIDIRHGKNLTPSRWSQDQFRNKNSCLGWIKSDEIPGWGKTKDRFWQFLQDIR